MGIEYPLVAVGIASRADTAQPMTSLARSTDAVSAIAKDNAARTTVVKKCC